ncbi:MAG: MFS transporter [Gammaproteobacteria bacterium]
MSEGTHDRMYPTEIQAIASIGLLYIVRMLGLFMVLPVMVLHADDYTGSTPFLIGLAIGIYGLTQACMQIPFGLLSDRIGRKTVIYTGLVLFGLGSIVAAQADTLWGVIIGRGMQGAGAIASTLLALLSDLTRDHHRAKAMAGIGMSIGIAFALSLWLGPWISAHYGLSGIFLVTAGFAVLGVAVVAFIVPAPPSRPVFNAETTANMQLLSKVIKDTQLLRLDTGIFVLHFILTASFIGLPLVLRDTLGLQQAQHGYLYLPVMGVSFIGMVPILIWAERRQRVIQAFIGAILALIIACSALAVFHDNEMISIAAVFLFFTAFNLQEANLPSLISRQAFAGGKGTAMGIYSTSQFLGIFSGGSLGGLAMSYAGLTGLFSLCLFAAIVWLAAALGMQMPKRLKNIVLQIGPEQLNNTSLLTDLVEIQGVEDVMIFAEHNVVYLKVDEGRFDHACLDSYAVVDAG